MAKKPQYFDPKFFVDKVMNDVDFGEIDQKTRSALEEGIQRRLAERIVAAIIDGFNEREFVLLENVIENHPELDDIDAIMLISNDIPNLKDRLEKAITDLYDEMVYDATQIQEAMDRRQEAESVPA
jgi:hypothetical protein